MKALILFNSNEYGAQNAASTVADELLAEGFTADLLDILICISNSIANKEESSFSILKNIQKDVYDFIVCINTAAAELVSNALRSCKSDLPIYLIDTQYYCGSKKRIPGINKVFVTINAVRNEYIWLGYDRENVIVSGLPISFESQNFKSDSFVCILNSRQMPIDMCLSLISEIICRYKSGFNLIVIAENKRMLKLLSKKYRQNKNITVIDDYETFCYACADIIITPAISYTAAISFRMKIPVVFTNPQKWSEKQIFENLHNLSAIYDGRSVKGVFDAIDCLMNDNRFKNLILSSQEQMISSNSAKIICNEIINDNKKIHKARKTK